MPLQCHRYRMTFKTNFKGIRSNETKLIKFQHEATKSHYSKQPMKQNESIISPAQLQKESAEDAQQAHSASKQSSLYQLLPITYPGIEEK